MRTTNDYSKFSPKCYLSEYYNVLNHENSFILKFLHETYKNISSKKTMIEFGGVRPFISSLALEIKCKRYFFQIT